MIVVPASALTLFDTELASMDTHLGSNLRPARGALLAATAEAVNFLAARMPRTHATFLRLANSTIPAAVTATIARWQIYNGKSNVDQFAGDLWYMPPIAHPNPTGAFAFTDQVPATTTVDAVAAVGAGDQIYPYRLQQVGFLHTATSSAAVVEHTLAATATIPIFIAIRDTVRGELDTASDIAVDPSPFAAGDMIEDGDIEDLRAGLHSVITQQQRSIVQMVASAPSTAANCVQFGTAPGTLSNLLVDNRFSHRKIIAASNRTGSLVKGNRRIAL